MANEEERSDARENEADIPEAADRPRTPVDPRPSAQRVVPILLVIVLSVAMLVWFYGDLSYCLQGLSPAQALGDAAALELGGLEHNTYVIIEGTPLAGHGISFNERTALFNKNRLLQLFQLSSLPRFFVQWELPAGAQSPRGPIIGSAEPMNPGSFVGRLVRRDKLDSSYDEIWASIAAMTGSRIRSDAWLLLADEQPSDKLWVAAMYVVFLLVIGINAARLYRIWRARSPGKE